MEPKPNIGTRIDHKHNHEPVCEECILAAAPSRLRYYRKIAKPKKPCWSCQQMIDESAWQQAELDKENDAFADYLNSGGH